MFQTFGGRLGGNLEGKPGGRLGEALNSINVDKCLIEKTSVLIKENLHDNSHQDSLTDCQGDQEEPEGRPGGPQDLSKS